MILSGQEGKSSPSPLFECAVRMIARPSRKFCNEEKSNNGGELAGWLLYLTVSVNIWGVTTVNFP